MLTIRQLDLSYPGYPPLATIDWTIGRGQHVALLGRSGVGKSTLLKALLETPTPPQIQCDTTRIAYMAQSPVLLPWLNARDNVMLGARLRGEQSPDTAAIADALLHRVGLSGLATRAGSQLSGGQKSRVALARCLFEEAELVLLDEPFAALDRSTRIEMAELCRELLVDQTVILVTHDPRDASDWLEAAWVLSAQRLSGPLDLHAFQNDRELIRALDGAL
jgi:putative hydroxymethylpyrimidine transport system ATP-binding protein